MQTILSYAVDVINLLAFAILIRAILSWFPISPGNPLVTLLDTVTNPIVRPIRRVMPRMGMIDFTPMIAMLALFAIARILEQGIAGA
jgi:YggT family protein